MTATPGARRPENWQAFDRGLGRQIRTNWRRRPSPAVSPRTEALALLEQRSQRLRLNTTPRDAAHERNRRYVIGVLKFLVAATLIGQRVVIPITGTFFLSFPLIAMFVALALLGFRRAVVYNRVRTELYVASLTVLVLATWSASWIGNTVSINSLLLLLALYLPWTFCIAPQYRDAFVPVMSTFVKMMVGFSLLGGMQMIGQLLLGWQYTDYVQNILGKSLIDQNFNTQNELAWNNPLVKANAFVFLEPSFLCQFCALALIVAVMIRSPAWMPLTLGLGIASTLSGTGILLLIVGGVMVALRAPNRIAPRTVVAGLVCLGVVFATPAAGILLGRTGETSQSGSSGSLRFVQPYTGVITGLQEEPSRYLVGAGPGSSDRVLVSTRSGGEAVVYSIAPKVAFEYGLIGMTVFVAFLLVSILKGPPVPVLGVSVIFMIFFLSGALLQPHTIVMAWLATSLWGTPVTVGISDALAASRRSSNSEPVGLAAG